MKQYEYNIVSQDRYIQYRQKAYEILGEIGLDPKLITYKHIINHFRKKYNIKFVLFDVEYPEFGIQPKINDYFGRLLNTNIIQGVDMEFIKKCSGMIIPKKDKYVIMINQSSGYLERIIFTVLHELSHVHCHLQGNMNRTFMSLNNDMIVGEYPKDLQPFEDEANIVASILYLPDETIVDLITKGYSYDEIQKEVQISKTALFNRLRNFLIYKNTTPYEATNIVTTFRNGAQIRL